MPTTQPNYSLSVEKNILVFAVPVICQLLFFIVTYKILLHSTGIVIPTDAYTYMQEGLDRVRSAMGEQVSPWAQ